MTSFKPPKNPVVKMEKDVQIVKDKYIESKNSTFTLYSGVLTFECAQLTLKSYESAFPTYKHKIEHLSN